MNVSAGLSRKRTGNHQTGEAAPRPKVDPNLGIRREVEQLQRIGDVPRPEMRHCGWRNQVRGPLPPQQKPDKPVEAVQCFT
jgi:hypothetical protein